MTCPGKKPQPGLALCRGGAGPKGKAGPVRRLHDGGAAGTAGHVHRREKRGRGHAGL